MLGYNIRQEARGTYGGYPRWAIAVFGWVPCVVVPLSFMLYGCFRPLHLVRPEAGGDGAAGHDRDRGGGGERSTEMAALNASKVSSDDYRDEEEEANAKGG